MTRILTRADIGTILTLDDCIAAVEDVFRDYGERRIAAPQSLGVQVETGTFHIKTAVTGVFAAKINANLPGNPRRHDLPTIQGVIVLIDAERGTPLAILDSTLITSLRTAAATAVAARVLARSDARTLTIAGCGAQGRTHLEALLRVRPITKAYVFDCEAAATERFVQEMRHRAGVELVPVKQLDAAVAESDIVATCTPSRTAFLERRHLHAGIFIAGVGADNPDKQELAGDLLAGSRVVVDILGQAAVMGDLHHAIEAGMMRLEDVHGELADVICGRVPARRTDNEIFVYDSTGTALQDAAAASVAYKHALDRGVGMEVALSR